MGSDATDPVATADERPKHSVRLTRDFWLGETEVTQEQWTKRVGSNPSDFRACGGTCPVEQVSWWEAAAFANLLSKEEGLEPCFELTGCTGALGVAGYYCETGRLVSLTCEGYRLPTEAEWEVAARAGTSTPIYTGALRELGLMNSPDLDPIAWYSGNSGVGYGGAFDCRGWPQRPVEAESCGTHPVGLKQPNSWGFFDLLGNVAEWTASGYSAYGGGPVQDPLEPADSGYFVARGASWIAPAGLVRAAARFKQTPSVKSRDLGLRLARTGKAGG